MCIFHLAFLEQFLTSSQCSFVRLISQLRKKVWTYGFEILLWRHIQNVQMELLISSKGVVIPAKGLIKYCDWPLPPRAHKIPAPCVKKALACSRPHLFIR